MNDRLFQRVIEATARFDALDLLTAVAALQMMPANISTTHAPETSTGFKARSRGPITTWPRGDFAVAGSETVSSHRVVTASPIFTIFSALPFSEALKHSRPSSATPSAPAVSDSTRASAIALRSEGSKIWR